MPFKSEKQRRYLYANEPKLAKKWSNMYGDKIVGLGGVNNLYKGKYKYYKNKSKDYVSGEIAHIERSIRAFKRDSSDFAKERVKDYSKHLNKIRKIFHSKKQGYKDREDESLGMRRGAERGKKQSYKDRRNESYGKFGKRDKEKKGKNKINKISGLGGVSTDEYLMKIAATLLAKGLNPSRYAKYKAKAYLKDVKAKEKVYELIDKKSADIVIYMKRIKNL